MSIKYPTDAEIVVWCMTNMEFNRVHWTRPRIYPFVFQHDNQWFLVVDEDNTHELNYGMDMTGGIAGPHLSGLSEAARATIANLWHEKHCRNEG